jgi:uncharacterized integral membrane protein
MNKRFLTGIILIGVAVLVLLLSGNSKISLYLLVDSYKIPQSIGLFAYLTTGMLIGFLLR